MTRQRPAVFRYKIPGLLLACMLSLGLLVLVAIDLHDAFLGVTAGNVMASITDQIRSSGVTMRRIHVFLFTVLMLYLLIGTVAWLLTRLSVAAYASLQGIRHLLLACWFVALGFLVGLYNADHYPWSRSGKWSRAVEDFLAPPVPLWTLVAPALGAIAIFLFLKWIRRRGLPRHGLRVLVWTCVLVLGLFTLKRVPLASEAQAGSMDPARPNIILIGIDSLRPALVGGREEVGYMPSLTSFVESGHRFTDATTPLARTFPSWMSLLTGRRPATTGIRENLVPRSSIEVQTLADILGNQGYQTIFATDDVRFSNIDSSYGFETVLSPRIGVTDFLLGGLADIPLVNLVANTRVGKWLFPDSYANRAAATTYDPATFVEWLDSDVDPDGRPLFLSMHLTLAHYPYSWREDNDAVFSRTSETAYAYLAAVVEVDKQFASIIRLLEDKGLLRNTLVVAFSDHGEGLNLPADRESLFAAADLGVEGIPIWSSGHGNTVLSDSQFEIFMAARSFGLARYPESRGVHRDPVSIEDVTPTVLDVAGVDASPYQFDGQSFAGYLSRKGNDADHASTLRVRFTESAYTTPSLQQGTADDVTLMQESVGFFQVNTASGWVEVKPDLWPRFLEVRERAALGPTQLLAAVPSKTPGQSWYLLVPRAGGSPRKLPGRPGADLGAEAAALWDGLAREYEGELGDPAP